MYRSIPALALAATMATFSPSMAQEPVHPPRIVVAGEGEAAARPDMANLSLSVLREADTAREALEAASASMREVIAAMKEAGIADRDLQTSGIQINPRYVHPRPGSPDTESRIVGYQVTQTLSVRVRELERLGEIIDRSVDLGVNQGGGVAFGNQEPDATIAEARRRAVRDARTRAETLADAAGVTLGRIVEISEQPAMMGPPRPFMARQAEDMAASIPIEAGENAYRVQVRLTFEIGE